MPLFTVTVRAGRVSKWSRVAPQVNCFWDSFFRHSGKGKLKSTKSLKTLEIPYHGILLGEQPYTACGCAHNCTSLYPNSFRCQRVTTNAVARRGVGRGCLQSIARLDLSLRCTRGSQYSGSEGARAQYPDERGYK